MRSLRNTTLNLILISLLTLNLWGQNNSCDLANSIDIFPTFDLGCNNTILNEELLICDSISEFFNIKDINLNTYQLIREEEHPLDINFNICDGGVFDNPIFIPFIADSTFHSIDVIPIICDSFQLGPNTLSGIQAAIWETCDGEKCLASNIACNIETSTMTINLESSEFNIGSTYYLVVDGCGGSICQFQISFEAIEKPIEFNNVSFACDIQNTSSHWYKYDISSNHGLSSIVLDINNFSLFDSTIINTYHGNCDSISLITSQCYLEPSQNFISFVDLENIVSGSIYFEVITQSKNCHLFQLKIKENENICSQGTIHVSRPENSNLNAAGPYCPGEIITVCYELDFRSDQPGLGNNCQWLQGIVPVINGDIDSIFTIESLKEAQIALGWTWLDTGSVDFNSLYSSYKYTNTNLGLGIEYGVSELTTGDIVPNGWWYTSPGTGCSNDGDPDNMWGLPSPCDFETKIDFCFDIKIQDSENLNCSIDQYSELSIEIFAFADGSTGCVQDDYCSFDKPAQFKGNISCEVKPNVVISEENIASGDTIEIQYLEIKSLLNIEGQHSVNDKIEGPFDFAFNTNNDTIIKWIVLNTSDTVQSITFTYMIEGPNNCVSVNEQATINVDPDPTINIFIEEIQNPTCGKNNGLITISTSQNNSIEWSNGSNSNTIDSLSEGDYSVTVSNQNLVDSLTIRIVAEDFLRLEISEYSDTICPYDGQGYITLSVSDSLQNFEILWNTGDKESEIEALDPGVYSATLTDQNQCVDSVSIEILAKELPQFNLISEDSDCSGNGTTIRIEDFDSTLISQIVWSDGSIEDSLSNISEGLYVATVTDINGCNQVLEHVVQFIDNTPPTLILEDITYILPANGFVPEFTSFQFVNTLLDNCNGTITVTPSTVQLDCTEAGENKIPVIAEDQSGNITYDTLMVIIIDDSPPFIFCPPSLTVFGCEPTTYDLPFQLDNCGIESIALITGLGSGSIFPEGLTQERFLAKDYGGNIDSCLVEITVDYGIDYQMVSLDVSCPNEEDGSLIFNGSAVNEPISFNVTNYSGSLFNVPAGEYYIEIVDSSGCMLLDTLVVDSPEEIIFSSVNVIPFDSFTGNNGFINIEVQGGTPPYAYLWRKNGSIFSQDEDLENLEKGIYTVLIKDAISCEFVSQEFAIGILTSDFHIERNQHLKIYPNPSSDFIKIETELAVNYTKLYNTQGELLRHFNNLQSEIDVSKLSSGIYVLLFDTSSGQYIERIVKH